jgi:hypothetical protein
VGGQRDHADHRRLSKGEGATKAGPPALVPHKIGADRRPLKGSGHRGQATRGGSVQHDAGRVQRANRIRAAEQLRKRWRQRIGKTAA